MSAGSSTWLLRMSDARLLAARCQMPATSIFSPAAQWALNWEALPPQSGHEMWRHVKRGGKTLELKRRCTATGCLSHWIV